MILFVLFTRFSTSSNFIYLTIIFRLTREYLQIFMSAYQTIDFIWVLKCKINWNEFAEVNYKWNEWMTKFSLIFRTTWDHMFLVIMTVLSLTVLFDSLCTQKFRTKVLAIKSTRIEVFRNVSLERKCWFLFPSLFSVKVILHFWRKPEGKYSTTQEKMMTIALLISWHPMMSSFVTTTQHSSFFFLSRLGKVFCQIFCLRND